MEKNMPKNGEFCWNELMTSDVKKAKEFYRDLFGWSFEDKDMEKMQYTMITAGCHNGGMLQIPAHQSGQLPPRWLTYVYADDIEQSVEKAIKLGAKIIVPTTDVEDFGRFAIIADPSGAHIGLWQCLKSCS